MLIYSVNIIASWKTLMVLTFVFVGAHLQSFEKEQRSYCKVSTLICVYSVNIIASWKTLMVLTFAFVGAHLQSFEKVQRSYCKMFYVAIGDNWCSVVPQSWINTEKKLCVWPSHGINTSKAIKKASHPQPSWESVLYKYLLGPYNSFEEAKNKEKDAEFVSSDDAKINALQNKENILPLKREKKPKLYDSSNDIESTDTDSIFEKEFKSVLTTSEKNCENKMTLKQNKIVKKIVPIPPSHYKVYNHNSNKDIRKKDIQLEQDSSSDINESQSFHYSDYLSQNEECFQDDIWINSQKDIPKHKYLERYPKKTNTNATLMEEKRSVPVIKSIDYNPVHHFKIKKDIKHDFCKGKNDSTLQMQHEERELMKTDSKETSNKEENVQEGYLTLINRILDTVLVINKKLDSMSAMNRKLDAILAFHDEQNPLVTNNFLDLLPIFPLNSVEDFKKFTTDLNENEELRKQFQKKIRSVGGKTPEHHLINCLVICLTNELAMHLTWEGQRQTEGIKNTTFATIITGTISNMYSSSNYYNLNNKFSEWLRRTGDRYRYQLKKLERHT